MASEHRFTGLSEEVAWRESVPPSRMRAWVYRPPVKKRDSTARLAAASLENHVIGLEGMPHPSLSRICGKGLLKRVGFGLHRVATSGRKNWMSPHGKEPRVLPAPTMSHDCRTSGAVASSRCSVPVIGTGFRLISIGQCGVRREIPIHGARTRKWSRRPPAVDRICIENRSISRY